jgi:excisionase family DNA binding protein
MAREAGRQLLPFRRRNLRIEIPKRGHGAEMVEVPATAVNLLVQILDEMAAGNAITITPIRTELTTRQAAAILNVSRPYLIKLLEEGKIEYRKVGRHRRVPTLKLMEYKQRSDAERRSTMDELAAMAQEDGGY